MDDIKLKKENWGNIDGYVTKDDMYRLISRHKPYIGEENAHRMCEAVLHIPTDDVMRDAMKLLQRYCRLQASCPKCIFANRKDGSCDINVPDSWTESGAKMDGDNNEGD